MIRTFTIMLTKIVNPLTRVNLYPSLLYSLLVISLSDLLFDKIIEMFLALFPEIFRFLALALLQVMIFKWLPNPPRLDYNVTL